MSKVNKVNKEIHIISREELKPDGFNFSHYNEDNEEIVFCDNDLNSDKKITRYSETPYGYKFSIYDDEICCISFIKDCTVREYAQSRWTSVVGIEGFWVGHGCNPVPAKFPYRTSTHKVIFRTHNQCEASVALAMLSQQLDIANKGWTPDWNSRDEYRYSISYPNSGNNDFLVLLNIVSHKFLTFKREEVAEEFLKTNIDLIKQAAVFLT